MASAIRRVRELLIPAAVSWNNHNSSTTGAALAFYSAFSLAPLLVIILTIAGWVVGAEFAYGQISAQLNALFGPATATTLMGAVKSSQKMQGVVSTIVSIATLVLGATTVLSALETALERIFHSELLVPKGLFGWVRSRLLSLGFILTLGFLLLVSLAISTGMSSLRARIAAHYAAAVGVLGVVDLIISLGLVAVLFALIFRYMPVRRTPWKASLIGGLLTAVLFNVGRWAVGLYLAHSTQPSAFGAASSFVALLLWLYYTAQIFLFGAEFTAQLSGAARDAAPDHPTHEAAKRAPRKTLSSASASAR